MSIRLNKKWPAFSWLLAILLFTPFVAIISQSFVNDEAIFSHLWLTVLPDYIINTVLVVLGVVIVSFFFGVPTAWLVAMCEFPGRRFFVWSMMLPLAMPAYVVAYIYTDLFDCAGPIQNWLRGFDVASSGTCLFEFRSVTGSVLVLSLVLYPYVYLLARTAFLEQSNSLLQSAKVLGCSPWQSFYRVSLPLARPAIMVSLTLVAMETLADFAVMKYFAVPTMTTAVYDTWLGYGSLAAAARLSSLMLIAIFILVAIERIGRQKQKHYQKTTGQEKKLRYVLSNPRAFAAFSTCLLVFAAGFILPMFFLLSYAFDYFNESWTAEFFQYSLNSFTLATLVSLICLLIGLFLAYFKRLSSQSSAGIPSKIASTGYALPGTVLAIGVLIPLSWLDHGLNHAIEWFGMQGPGLIFSGSIFAITAGYVVRFAAISIGSLESSLGKVSPSIDMVSVTLGLSPLKTLFKVHLPLVKKGFFAAALLVFIESMKELPAALLLRPFGFETLATYVYQFVSDEQLELGALAAIVIVLVGLIPLLLLNRSLEKTH